MKAVSKKLTVKEVQERVKEILARRSVTCGKSSWIDPEGVQGLIDDLRTDVIQAIADGSKVPYALTRCIAELPRVHYGTIPSEPARTTVEKVAASFARSFNKNWSENPIIGIDGEGITTPDGRHLYIYIAAVDEEGKVWGERYDRNGLSHDDCMEVLLALPRQHLIFGYMISYDMTKILEELPDELKYALMRPDERKRRTCTDCRHSWTVNVTTCPKCGCTKLLEHSMALYHEGRQYQFAQACYTFSDGFDKRTRKWDRTVKIWDCFRFFAMPFISALKAWDCGTPEERETVAAMKEQRGEFAHVSIEKICEYCKKECHLLAKMMRKVIQSHIDVELDPNARKT